MELNPEDIQPESDEEPLKLFHDAIKSPETDKDYTKTLRMFMCDVLKNTLHGTFEERAKEFVEIGRKDPKEMRGILLGLSRIMRKRTKEMDDPDYLNPSSIPTYFNAIKKLLNTNDVTVNWKRVSQTFPERDNVDDSRYWTRKDIRRMLDHAGNAKYRAIILVLASSGMRCGSMQLRWGDITRVYIVNGKMVEEEDVGERALDEPACAVVRAYKGTFAEYVTFITPEAHLALMDYADSWANDMGRRPKPEDPIFKSRKNQPTMMAKRGIITGMVRIASSAGVRKRQRNNLRRWEVPLFNGFRRFFDKAIKDAKSNESTLSALIKSEFIMGHGGLVQLDASYYKADVKEKAKTYVNAVPDLTISESKRSKQTDKHVDEVMPGLDRLDDRISRLDVMSQSECIGLLEGMLDYLRRGKFADSDDPA